MTQVSERGSNRAKENWLNDLIRHSRPVGSEVSQIATRSSRNSLCAICKGARFLCGKTRCPIMVKVGYYLRSVPLMASEDITGVSPPSVFIGRMGYPHVFAGPLVPPVTEDTSLYDLPEQWFGKSIDEIIGFRSLLIRGKHRVHVQKFNEGGKIMDLTRELALAENGVDLELNLTKRPRGSIFMDDDVQPFGPSAHIRDLHLGNARFERRIERAYNDTDLSAGQAVRELYGKGVLVTRIQRAFSVGAFGVEKNRRLVPTRWSITAVDDIVSKDLVQNVKTFPEVNEFRVYESDYLDNLFEVLVIPGRWSYECMEAWYPGTVWNPNGRRTLIFSDWEGNDGRSTYAAIGGCYYSARLAVCELLVRERRQATVVVLREARPGYIMPMGVWQVRENVRNAMRQKPYRFKSLDDSLKFIAGRFEIPLRRWVMQSALLKDALFQKKLTDFFSKSALTQHSYKK